MKNPQDFAFHMYMAECENRFPEQREASIQAAIEDFREIKDQGYNPNDYIDQVLASHNLKEYWLSNSEIDRINRAVNA